MLLELDVLETRRIADMALEARKARGQPPEKVPESRLWRPAHGAYALAGSVALRDVQRSQPEMRALWHAIMALPRDIREKTWSVACIGAGAATIRDWDGIVAEAALLTDDELTTDLADEPDLHDRLARGLAMVRKAGG
ncbi:DUF3775 domain-containing protein [Rhodopila globiformis]|uniref:Uncharacterized protein n=1 Tax=Rhodopila globiformis TaxID=1071 RepID=A0A2S6NLF2_RHOGL|nr:DUF3775 domain-containing protein [Rhodopila globiformis]PPQ36098.1 hypothetical protein CCS01_05730 [Rhodopila globiformis]